MTFDEMLGRAPDGLRDFYREFDAVYRDIPGSGHNHQSWPGGYRDHLAETGTIAVGLYEALSSIRPLPFTVDDALTVLLLHDVEKVKRWPGADRHPVLRLSIDGDAFKREVISRYRIGLSDEQLNALRYVHGEPDHEHDPSRRLAGRLAAFVHTCDYLSARLWFDEPRSARTT